MDSPDPLAQATVERNISELSSELGEITTKLYAAAREAAVARHAYRVAFARALLKAEGTVADKEAIATVESSSHLLERELAVAVEDSLKESGRNVRAQLEGQRSLCANLRGAITYASGQGG